MISICSMREVLRHCMFNSTGILVSEQQEWFCRERYGNLPFWLILCDDRTEALCEEKLSARRRPLIGLFQLECWSTFVIKMIRCPS